jgi:predicted DCC family thiol-disulfide oxidoreductase YuxK
MVPPSPQPAPPEAIVLFDGVCNLCNGWVSFLLRRDPAGRLRFGSLQSDAAAALLARHGRPRPAQTPESVVLIEGGRVYEASTAVLRAMGHLRGAWRFAVALQVVPAPLRDVVYRAVARSRYRLFGKRDTCRVPTEAERARFIDTARAVNGAIPSARVLK